MYGSIAQRSEGNVSRNGSAAGISRTSVAARVGCAEASLCLRPGKASEAAPRARRRTRLRARAAQSDPRAGATPPGRVKASPATPG